jgi:hypothetical protein
MAVMELRSSWTGNPLTAKLGSLETSRQLTQPQGVTSQKTGALLSICLIYRDIGNARLQKSWRRDAATTSPCGGRLHALQVPAYYSSQFLSLQQDWDSSAGIVTRLQAGSTVPPPPPHGCQGLLSFPWR